MNGVNINNLRYIDQSINQSTFYDSFREVEDMKGINIGGVNINNLRYADDTVLLAEGPMFLQALLTAVNEKGNHMAWK